MLADLWADGDTQDHPELILVRTRTPVVVLAQTVAEMLALLTVWPLTD